jgi:hypothetical protein
MMRRTAGLVLLASTAALAASALAFADATGVVNGKSYSPGPAPRLSVFSWNGTRRQLAAHANFDPLKG